MPPTLFFILYMGRREESERKSRSDMRAELASREEELHKRERQLEQREFFLGYTTLTLKTVFLKGRTIGIRY